MIPLDDARAFVLSKCSPLPAAAVRVDDALDLVLAADVWSREEVPPFANTAMDGYAVRAADTAAAPVELDVIATLAAGAAPSTPVGVGQAIRIMTGAPMPPGADAVVMVEWTEPLDDGGRVRVQRPVTAGNHVRPAGEDLRAGQLVFAAGTELGPGHLGVLASVGELEALVHRRPRVGVLSTGDELVDDGRPLEPGQIRDSNRHTLLALLARTGCTGVDLGCAPDDEDAITAAIERAVGECDALVTSGGVSMGAFDYVKVVLDRMGDMRWMQVAIKPAKPLAFGTVGGVPVFGLPGNPVSSMVSFELFARPALRKMMGHPEAAWVRPTVAAVADERFGHHPDGKVHFNRVTAVLGPDGRVHIRAAGGQGSHQLFAMATSQALAVVGDDVVVEAGGEVPVLLLEPLV